MKLTTNARGFKVGEFKDANGKECSLQKSSSAEEPMIWLGVNEPEISVFAPGSGWSVVPVPPCPPGGHVLVSGRMHLSRKMVAALLPYLTRFAEYGELDSGRKALEGKGCGRCRQESSQ